MKKTTNFSFLIYSFINLFFISCTKVPVTPTTSSNIYNNPGTATGFLHASIEPAYTLKFWPENSARLVAMGFVDGAVFPSGIKNTVWSKVLGPDVSIQPISDAAVDISFTASGVFVFECEISEETGIHGTAQSVVAIADSSINSEVNIPNQRWILDPTGFGFDYININPYNYIPAGKAIKKVFVRPDCSNNFIEAFLSSQPSTSSPYYYTVAYANGVFSLLIENGNTGCIVQGDSPDIRIVY